VTIRYDPRDLGEIRVFHRNQFVCRAISPEYAGTPITLKDIQAARTAHRRALRARLNQRRAAAGEYLPRYPSNQADPATAVAVTSEPPSSPPAGPARPRPRLYTYLEDRPGHQRDQQTDEDEGDSTS
jgi:putative transposase